MTKRVLGTGASGEIAGDEPVVEAVVEAVVEPEDDGDDE
jgi:hypothetical protein